MSGNNKDYDNQNDDSQNYDDDENQDQDQDQDQDQEYDSQDGNSQNNGDNGDGDGDGDDDDGDQDDNNEGNDDNDDDEEDEDADDGNGDGDGDDNSNGPKYIRLRGLPWSATHKEILDFLKNVTVIGGAEGIHLITSRWDGKNTGEAYVEVKGQQDVIAAMKLDNAAMGHRYIEVFNAAPKEAKDAMRKTSSHGVSYVVKLRGLPYSVTEQQVEEFFNGLEIKPDREGIIFVMDRRGRATGEAFVQFESQEDTEQALGRNREKIGHRYIEIFRSSLAELKRTTNGNGRMAPYDLKDRGSNRGGGGSGSDYGGNSRNRWGNGGNSGFGVGANNTLGFNNLPNFNNNGNFGNNGGGGNFGNNGGGNFGSNGGGNFGNNGGGGNFGNNGGGGGGNFGNNSGGGNSGGGFNRFSANSGNFGNDFGDFGNFGNNRGNSGGGGGGGNNNGGGGGGFNNFANFGNCGGNNLGGGFGNNMDGGNGSGGNFGPIGGGRNDDYYIIHMRGLPFSSFEDDVYKFFFPIRTANVRIHYNDKNRHNGTAEALFESYDDAQVAMTRHRAKMGSRYIELFFNGKASKGGSGGGFGNNYSSGGSIGSGKSMRMGGNNARRI